MRILIVSPTYFPHPGGCAKSTKYLYEGIGENFKKELLVVSKNKFEEKDGVSYLSLDPRRVFDFFKIVLSIRTLIISKKYDVIHVYNVFMLPHVNVAAAGTRCKVYGTLNNLNWGCVNPNYYSEHKCSTCTFSTRSRCTSLTRSIQFYIGTKLLKYSERLFCFSDVFKKIYSMQGIAQDKFTLIQNFKSDDMNPSGIVEVAPRKSIIKFISIGNIDERKGIHILYDAFSYIKSAACPFASEVELVILGEGEQRYVDLFNDLDGVTCKLVVPDSYEFYEELSSSDVLIHPAICNEAFARVWMEAGMYGLALISSDTDSAKEILSSHATYYNRMSSDSLIHAVEAIVYNLDYLSRMKKLSRYWFDGLLSNEEVIESITREYKRNDK